LSYINSAPCGYFDIVPQCGCAQCGCFEIDPQYGCKEKIACGRYNEKLTHSGSKNKLAQCANKEKLSRYQQWLHEKDQKRSFEKNMRPLKLIMNSITSFSFQITWQYIILMMILSKTITYCIYFTTRFLLSS
jgi:hypothetical protein